MESSLNNIDPKLCETIVFGEYYLLDPKIKSFTKFFQVFILSSAVLYHFIGFNLLVLMFLLISQWSNGLNLLEISKAAITLWFVFILVSSFLLITISLFSYWKTKGVRATFTSSEVQINKKKFNLFPHNRTSRLGKNSLSVKVGFFKVIIIFNEDVNFIDELEKKIEMADPIMIAPYKRIIYSLLVFGLIEYVLTTDYQEYLFSFLILLFYLYFGIKIFTYCCKS